MTREEPRRIGIITSYSRLAVVPSLISLLKMLAGHGYALDIYAWMDMDPPPPVVPLKNVRFFFLPQQGRRGQARWRRQFLLRSLPFLVSKVGRQRNCCLVGVDHWGLLLAGITAALHRIPAVYLSLEVYFRRELTTPYLKGLMLAAKWCNQHTAFTLIQDEARAGLLVAENRIAPRQIVYLPNSWWGEINPGEADTLRQTLGIAPDRTVVLYAGSIARWTQTLELARAARSWSDNLAMVFQAPGPLESEYEQSFLRQIDGRQTYLSRVELDLQQLTGLVGAADIGVALHTASEQEKNIYTMGLSSGKIAFYLQCGLPIVTTGFPSVREFVDAYRCGICVDRVEEVEGAIRTIRANYAEFSQNALTCFQEKFDLTKQAPVILRRFDQAISRP